MNRIETKHLLGEGGENARRGRGKGKKAFFALKISCPCHSPPIPAQVKTCDEIQLLKSNPELLEAMKASSVSDTSQNFHCSSWAFMKNRLKRNCCHGCSPGFWGDCSGLESGRLTLAGRTGSELRERSQRGVARLPPPSGGPRCSAVNSPSSQTGGKHRLPQRLRASPGPPGLRWSCRWPLPEKPPPCLLSLSSPAAPCPSVSSTALPARHTGILKPAHPKTKAIITC